MPGRARRYTLDTNLFVRGFRELSANHALETFHTAFAPFEWLTAVVAHELRAGARTTAVARVLQQNVLDVFERRGRLLTPSYDAWQRSGEALARLAATEGLDLGRVPKSFVNDVLLAATCRENGVVLITENARDFLRISAVAPFEFVPPWPAPTE